MCVYSVFVDEAGRQWPGLLAPWPPAGTPSWPPYNEGESGIPMPSVNPLNNYIPQEEVLREIRELGKRLDRLDKLLGAKDCTQEEEAKRAFEARIDALIKAAEDLKKDVTCDGPDCAK